jgi:hypothetical protein
MIPKLKKCRACNKEFKQYKTTDKFCSSKCFYSQPKKEISKSNIKPQSKKLIALNAVYLKKRKIHLRKNPNCAVFPNKKATEIHHILKRRGYADQYAEKNNIPLLIDERFFLAVSNLGHQKIENNPDWAYKNGFSLKNNTKKSFKIK